MAFFLDLYGELLDVEIGTTDRTMRFKTDRRKSAINRAMQHFNRLTNCYEIVGNITLVDTGRVYDLSTVFGNFLRLSPHHLPDIQFLAANGTYTGVAGPRDFPRRSADWLDANEPGWRNAGPLGSGTPSSWFIHETNGSMYFALNPPPSIPVGDTWTLHVPYIADPDVMTLDSDTPFSTSGHEKISLRTYHQALVHKAAADMESLRRNYLAARRQNELYAGFVDEYLIAHRPAGPQHVQVADYLGAANRMRWSGEDRGDPRR